MTLQPFGIYDGVLVMVDDETLTIWSHLGGKALLGPMEGLSMEVIPLHHMTWSKWRELHPDTLVLSPDTSYQRMYRDVQIGTPGMPYSFLDSFVNLDDRLPHNTLVAGVSANGAHRAYQLALAQDSGWAVNDELGGVPIVVVFDPESAFTLAYSRNVGERTLAFELDLTDGFHLRDTTTGTLWSIEGKGLQGELEGHSLDFVTSYITEWYGCAAYHPSTDIYQ